MYVYIFGPKRVFGVTPGELLTISKLTFTPNLRNSHHGKGSPNQISEIPSVDSTDRSRCGQV